MEKTKAHKEINAVYIAAKMEKEPTMKAFAPAVATMGTVTFAELEETLPEYIPGGAIFKLFEGV